MKRFTTKKDFWGNETYYNENGDKIGTSEVTWFGRRVIKDDYGNTVGKVTTDSLDRRIIEQNAFSVLTGHHYKTLLDSMEHEEWEYCDKCNEWDGGDDDCDCCDY